MGKNKRNLIKSTTLDDDDIIKMNYDSSKLKSLHVVYFLARPTEKMPCRSLDSQHRERSTQHVLLLKAESEWQTNETIFAF